MSKAYTESDFSDQLDSELIWRRQELSDLKSTIKTSDYLTKKVLLKSLITMLYAHWEGFVRFSANKYFEYISRKKIKFIALEEQFYINKFLNRLDSLYLSKSNIHDRCEIIRDILHSKENRFTYINPNLVDTKSNLNTDVIIDLCVICGIDFSYFEDKRSFIDIIILKRRNSIAHGQYEEVSETEISDLISEMLALMSEFRNLIENKIYLKSYQNSD